MNSRPVNRPIVSTKNPRVKALVRLRNRRERDATGLFLIEGYRELSRAVEAGVEILTVYACPDLYLGTNEDALVEQASAAGAAIVPLGTDAFRKVSYRDRPEGLIALARQFPTALERLAVGPNPLLLVVESIEKPGNLGTMLRTADAAGATGMIVCDPTTEPFNPNVLRASLGCLFLVPLAVAATDETLRWLRDRELTVYATTPAAPTSFWEADYRGPTAVVIGSEQYGLTDAWLGQATRQIRIPMAGRIDSLNAAMAAGITLFEAVRQRTASGLLSG